MLTPDAIIIVLLLVNFPKFSTQNGDITGRGHISKPIDLQARPYLTSRTSKFGPAIEGLSVTPSGQIYAVNYGDARTTNQLGGVFPRQRLFYADNVATAKFNGMEFLNENTALAVDQNNTRLLRLDVGSNGDVIRSQVQCADPTMIPPNDLAISFRTGFVYLSAMNWVKTTTNKDGEIWVCHTDGRPAKRLEVMGRVNGIELSPDEKTLYATESYTKDWVHIGQKIWKYDVDFMTGGIRNKRLFVDFAHVFNDSVKIDLDGLKADGDGHLLAVRYGGSRVDVFDEDGKLTTRIGLNFKNPTNLELDKVGRNTLFVCGQCNDKPKGCVDIVEWESYGRSWVPFMTNPSPVQRVKY